MLKFIVLRALLPYLLFALAAGMSFISLLLVSGVVPALVFGATVVIFARIRWMQFKKGLISRINVPLRDIRGKETTRLGILAEKRRFEDREALQKAISGRKGL